MHQHGEPLSPSGSFHNVSYQLDSNANTHVVDYTPGSYPLSWYKAIGASVWNCRRVACLRIIEHIVTGVCIYIIFTPSVMAEIRWMVGLPYALYSLFLVLCILGENILTIYFSFLYHILYKCRADKLTRIVQFHKSYAAYALEYRLITYDPRQTEV